MKSELPKQNNIILKFTLFPEYAMCSRQATKCENEPLNRRITSYLWPLDAAFHLIYSCPRPNLVVIIHVSRCSRTQICSKPNQWHDLHLLSRPHHWIIYIS